ncbi:MAG: hypothetical protein J6B46_00890 [Parabacteroides sp.]|nr:hypothetical protein [Parabacteroides sp.]
MKGKTLLFWSLVFVALCFFFKTFAFYTLQRQEEVQLFLPIGSALVAKLWIPGGFCSIVGQALVQYYPYGMTVLFVNALFLCLIGFLSFLLFQKIASRSYNLILALFPVWALAKAHVSPFYVLDGTVGIALLFLFLYGYVLIRQERLQVLYGVVSTCLLYLLAGQIVALYGLLLFTMTFMLGRKRWYYSLGVCALGFLLTFITIRFAISIPLTDGIYSERYQESQLQPDSYIYYVWIRFMVLVFFLLLVCFVLKSFSWDKRWTKIGITLFFSLLFGFFFFFNLPDQEEILNNEMDELVCLERQQDWEAIIRKYENKRPSNYIQLNYLSMALAQKEVLGDSLFHFEPKGPQSLLTSWDRTYYTSALLSDIHYHIGDISLSESYAMEGLTLAKRGGSPRMLQRLVEICLIREEWDLATKYLHILHQLPTYRSWAEEYQSYLYKPESVRQNSAFANKKLLKSQPNSLLCLLTIDRLWMELLSASENNRMVIEYLGCSYLLSKEMDSFKNFLLVHGKETLKGQWLPVHFQEAVLVLATSDPAILQSISVRPEIVDRFKQFQQDIRQAQRDSNGLAQLHRKYGHTFWFYYYCRNK